MLRNLHCRGLQRSLIGRLLPQALVVREHSLQHLPISVGDLGVGDGVPKYVGLIRIREGVLHDLLEDHYVVHALGKAVQQVDYVHLVKGRSRSMANLDACLNTIRRNR